MYLIFSLLYFKFYDRNFINTTEYILPVVNLTAADKNYVICRLRNNSDQIHFIMTM